MCIIRKKWHFSNICSVTSYGHERSNTFIKIKKKIIKFNDHDDSHLEN